MIEIREDVYLRVAICPGVEAVVRLADFYVRPESEPDSSSDSVDAFSGGGNYFRVGAF